MFHFTNNPCSLEKFEFIINNKKNTTKQNLLLGVPVVAQQLENVNSIHDVGSVPGPAQWVKEPVWPHAEA